MDILVLLSTLPQVQYHNYLGCPPISSGRNAGADRKLILTFIHLDLGKEGTDHSMLFSKRTPRPIKQYSLARPLFARHAAAWPQITAAKGANPYLVSWRHTFGLQIFDYWNDPNGFMIKYSICGGRYSQCILISYAEAVLLGLLPPSGGVSSTTVALI